MIFHNTVSLSQKMLHIMKVFVMIKVNGKVLFIYEFLVENKGLMVLE
jgi:hypothetical protein